jgi:hypothetical protein
MRGLVHRSLPPLILFKLGVQRSSPYRSLTLRDVFDNSKIVIKQGNQISTHYQGLIEQYQISSTKSFNQVYLEAIAAMIFQS